MFHQAAAEDEERLLAYAMAVSLSEFEFIEAQKAAAAVQDVRGPRQARRSRGGRRK